MKIIQFFFFTLMLTIFLNSTAAPNALKKGRNLFYASIDDKNLVYDAEAIFKELQKSDSLSGQATVYLGALMSIRGKHAFLPMQKYTRAKKGLAIMDEGIQQDSTDIESRFIRGMTCYHLPFFFGRGDTAREDFNFVMTHIADNFGHYDKEMILNVISFFKENLEWSESDQKLLRNVETELGNK